MSQFENGQWNTIGTDNTQLGWDIGTAYDLFVSLKVLHDPDNWGLRGAWAAGVRSRLSVENRDFLKEIVPAMSMPLQWIYELPAPKDSVAVLEGLAQLSASERFQLMHPLFEQALLDAVSAAGGWQTSHIKAVQRSYKPYNRTLTKKSAETIFAWWLDVEVYGKRLLAALTAYCRNYYAEEEKRIQPYLEAALIETRQSAVILPLPQLLENLSRGVQLSVTQLDKYKHTVLAPSFWSTPFLVKGMTTPDLCIYLYGARPDDASLVPGEVIPDALYRALKALADPTRLKILRYLSAEPHTPTELANKLRLRPPTVIHHLHTLRLAQLVYVAHTDAGRRYAARSEAVDETLGNLRQFLNA
jgi:DNA-binding transcriptional ArsR family regulator